MGITANEWMAGLLSLIAGLSTAVGGLIVIFQRRRSGSGFVAFAMGFSAGVMATVSIADLLPEAVRLLSSEGARDSLLVLLMAGVGMAVASLIDRVLPEDQTGSTEGERRAMQVGIFSMIALMLHNLPEGIATFMASYKDLSLGVSITAAIALHNIPEGIAIAVPIYYGSGSRRRALGYTLLSGLSEPLGAVFCFLLLRPFISDALLGFVFAAVAGIMLYIALDGLMPAAEDYHQAGWVLSGVLMGCAIMTIGLTVF